MGRFPTGREQPLRGLKHGQDAHATFDPPSFPPYFRRGEDHQQRCANLVAEPMA